MKTFLCYIHSAGIQTPQLRTVAAPDAAHLPDAISETMSSWPTLANIELVEVCTDANELVWSFQPATSRAAH